MNNEDSSDISESEIFDAIVGVVRRFNGLLRAHSDSCDDGDSERDTQYLVAQKIDSILSANSIGAYIEKYLELEKGEEEKQRYFPSSIKLAGDGPEFSLGGSDYSFARTVLPAPPHRLKHENPVAFSISIEQRALTSLMDICLNTEPSGFYSKIWFCESLRKPENFRAAIRVEKAFFYSKFAIDQFRYFSDGERKYLTEQLYQHKDEPHRNRLEHLESRRFLLLLKLLKPVLVIENKIAEKTYISALESIADWPKVPLRFRRLVSETFKEFQFDSVENLNLPEMLSEEPSGHLDALVSPTTSPFFPKELDDLASKKGAKKK